MFRSIFHGLARNPTARRFVENSRRVERMTRRFVAGQTLDDAIAAASRLDASGLCVTLDHLGESVMSEEEAVRYRDTCLHAMRRVANEPLRASISVKLTQFGLGLDAGSCRRNVRAVIEAARELNQRVEFDMEGSALIDRTLDLVKDMHALYQNVRAVIQAYLYRSAKDVEELSRIGVPVRLCKGAYRELPDVAYPRKTDVDANYRRLASCLLHTGTLPAFATHDPGMIGHVRQVAADAGRTAREFEFQMLYGIRRDLASELIACGYQVRLYLPYGNAWYPYFMRRLAERPANVIFFLRHCVTP